MRFGAAAVRLGLMAAYVLAMAGIQVTVARPAAAAVYCKTVGVPKGCVAAPPVAAVIYCTAPGVPMGCVARPVARAAIYCSRPGFPVGCVARPAGVVVAPRVAAPGVGRVGTPMNRGGPVNRVGRR